MKENFKNDERNNLLLSDKEPSSDLSSGTEGSFFNEEDINLIENKKIYTKKNIINGSISFVNKFEFMKKNNLFYNFYINDIDTILLMNIISLIFFLFILFFKLIFFLRSIIISNSIISIIIILFLLFTLTKIIYLYKDSKNNEKENENKDLMRLLIQKWNIYYSISLFLISLNFILKLILIDKLNFHYTIIIIIEILIILLSLIILGIIYYFTKSSDNNILIIQIVDKISFPYSISILLSYVIINFVDQLNNLIYNSSIYCFLLSCLSLLLMVYYNDILFSFLVLIYQIGGIKHISLYNMNFHLFSTLINSGFIFFMLIKNLRKGFLFSKDDNNYTLIDEQFQNTSEELDD